MRFSIVIAASFSPNKGTSTRPLSVALCPSFSLIGQHYQHSSHIHHHHQNLHHLIKSSLSISNNADNNVSGLTEDGDFAILGINAQNYREDDDDKNVNMDNNRQNPNTGALIGWQGVGNMLFNESLIKSGNVDIGVGPTNRYRNFRGNEVLPKELIVDQRVEEWLMEVMPSLDEYEVECYAQGLSAIGFRPQCASLCELQYDDLDFIDKALHRRYLFKEITGESHPFEPWNSTSLEKETCNNII